MSGSDPGISIAESESGAMVDEAHGSSSGSTSHRLTVPPRREGASDRHGALHPQAVRLLTQRCCTITPIGIQDAYHESAHLAQKAHAAFQAFDAHGDSARAKHDFRGARRYWEEAEHALADATNNRKE